MTCGPFQILDSNTGQVAATIDAHSDFVWSITFSPDGKRILSAAVDQTVKVHIIDW